ncbi:MAG TPA: hypothetical protein GXZ45_05105 [Propionibacterium sp.]|nr:hypothetical protein [Propionibacterium sp.]
MTVGDRVTTPVTIEQHGDEVYVEVVARLEGSFDGLGWADPVDPELVLVGENLFLRAGRFGAFATEGTVDAVSRQVRAAHQEFQRAAGC